MMQTERVTLGRTGLTVCRNGFGALPIQRISEEDAVRLILKACANGVDFIDTANQYTDSEQKIGRALKRLDRSRLVLATKTGAADAAGFRKHLEQSLRMLGTEWIDIYQFHNPRVCPLPGDGSGLYEAMLQARQEGKIRFIGLTNHRVDTAQAAVASGLYDTLQFPFSYLSGETEQALVEACRTAGMGFIAMKALCGGLITRARAAYAFFRRFGHVVPIWGIQRERELDEFLSCLSEPPEEDAGAMARDRAELTGEFCRGCGYCMPCPAGIEINTCARMSLLLRRSPAAGHLSPAGQAKMRKIRDCLDCGQCRTKCPYGLDTPALLKRNLADYLQVLAGATSPDGQSC